MVIYLFDLGVASTIHQQLDPFITNQALLDPTSTKLILVINPTASNDMLTLEDVSKYADEKGADFL